MCVCVYVCVCVRVCHDDLCRYVKWTTFSHLGKELTQETVLEYFSEIISHGFRISSFEISEDWMSRYGDLEWDLKRFPDPLEMIRTITEDGIKASLWVHPFCSPLSKAFFAGKRKLD